MSQNVLHSATKPLKQNTVVFFKKLYWRNNIWLSENLKRLSYNLLPTAVIVNVLYNAWFCGTLLLETFFQKNSEEFLPNLAFVNCYTSNGSIFSIVEVTLDELFFDVLWKCITIYRCHVFLTHSQNIYQSSFCMCVLFL